MLALAAMSMLTGAAWMLVIPPFEGPDEMFFYNRARELTEHPERRENLFYRLAAPVIRAQASASVAFGSSRVFDYGIERLTSELKADGQFETTVVTRRYGDARFTGSSATPAGGFEKGRGVELRLTFADGSHWIDYWDGRAGDKTFQYTSVDRAVSAVVDPDRKLLLDLVRRNNSRTLGPIPSGLPMRWAGGYMIWLQDLLLTAVSLV